MEKEKVLLVFLALHESKFFNLRFPVSKKKYNKQ